MSTGADCAHHETSDTKEWYLAMQRWPYGESPDYEFVGPFATEDELEEYERANYANPGGSRTDGQQTLAQLVARYGEPRAPKHARRW